MRPVRTVLTVAAMAVGLLVAGGPVAMAGPVAAVVAVPSQDPVPDPGAAQPAPSGDGTAQIASVSEVAQGLTGQQSSASDRSVVAVGPFASPAAKSAAIWDSRGRPERLIIIRRNGIDTVANGRLQRHIVRPVSSITIRGLAAYMPSTWLSIDGSTARLSASLVLSTGVALDVGAPVNTLLLTGGATAPAAASIFTGGGSLALRGVRISSADPVTGAPMPVGTGRPYILVSGGGRLDASDSMINDLGATIGPKTYAGLVFNAGSRGSVVRTALARNTVGLRLDQSDGVSLQDVAVSHSVTDGLVLTGDTGTVLVDVKSEANGKNGVIVSGRSSPRPITGVSTHANHDFGLVVDGQTRPQISAIVTADDGAGGMEINHSTDVSVTGFTATDEPLGIYTHVSSARVALDRLDITGGRRGVVVEKTTADLTLANSKVEGAELGVSLGGHQMRLTDVTVTDSTTAAVVERGAADVGFVRLTISGGKDGFIANPATTGVVVRDLAAAGISNTAVRALSPGEQILGGQINGSVTGIDVQAPTTLSGVTIVGADTGVRARTAQSVHADQVDVTAINVGISIADGTPFLLSDSRVHALESIRGTAEERGPNDLSLPALSVLGAIGVPLILFAVVLEMVAALRQRRSARRRNTPPPGLEGPSSSPVRPDAIATAR